MKNRLIILLFATFLMAEDSNLSIENSDTLLDNKNAINKFHNLNANGLNNSLELGLLVVSNPNPDVYAALANVVYDNVANIEKLQEIPRYSKHIEKIQVYVDDVNETKKIGYSIEKGNNNISKDEYLTQIRSLSKRNDEFKREAVSSFKSSISYKDNEFFSQMINSGLLDTQKYKSEIMDYYLDNANQIDATGVIQGFLDEDELLKKQAEASKKVVVTKKQIQDAKIKRLRQNDKNKEEKIQQELESELNQKKDEILQEQRDNLSK